MKTEITLHGEMPRDDKSVDAIIKQERETFGYRPYGEYSICTKEDCRRVLSIDEVYGVSDTKDGYKPLEELETTDLCDGPDCPECESPTIIVFNPQIYRPLLQHVLYPNSYGAVLTDETGAVRGNAIARETTLADFFDGVNYKGEMEYGDFRNRVEEVLGMGLRDDSEVLETNRITVQRPFRGGKGEDPMFRQLMRHTHNIKPENDGMPAFGAVSRRGNVLPMVSMMGFEPILEDEQGTLLVGAKEVGPMREAFNLSLEDFEKKLGEEHRKMLKEKRIDHSLPPKAKYYKKSPVLPAMEQAYREAYPGKL